MIVELTMHHDGEALTTQLPKAMTDRLSLSNGDRIYAVETEQGILLTTVDPDLARVMESGARISARYENALRELAK
ncbi:AbrB/MazE/SpoVT family DNA-binding domain-containing protein [Thiocystis violacea]|uniref:AbrB/MazE/SpoVT family DNA-binding domain-containing protein n=1 Tax=Thiocystis violacea TaxID=13725 RepID=UPI0019044EB8|nr:AbrB/MazE/SpoVT family DNA-binding domain-containing protein [Thiocystis violacea]